ncbi:hypothetical protein EQZ23_06850 [Sphingomonas sp. UV9]|uniref:hypothetical protein n=1 Tax=Sphingomonas sp. UV9 TaxID=1851410 RepID=UPI000FFBCCAF|nr:hypothetical protein [Sphingomonas sp. UV9]RXD04854.1 hypothetical protein EQZ23_06850 [Sphingomonas sp. UV9]
MRRKTTAEAPEPKQRRGLDVSRFGERPPLKDRSAGSTRSQRHDAWRSFRIVVVATRTLLHFGLPVTSRSIAAATRLLAADRNELEKHFHAQGRTMLAVVPVSEKTVLQNDMCACVLAAFTTSEARVLSRARPRGHIPKGWYKRPRMWLMEKLAQTTAERDDYKRRYEAAVQAQVPVPDEDSLLARLRQYAEAEASAKGIILPS